MKVDKEAKLAHMIGAKEHRELELVDRAEKEKERQQRVPLLLVFFSGTIVRIVDSLGRQASSTIARVIICH